MKNNSSKFVVFVDHCAEFNYKDCYVALDGNDVLEAIKSFEEKFNVYENRSKVYLYKMMQRKGRSYDYVDILINRGNGWNSEPSPIEEHLYCRIVDEYI